MPKIKKTDAFIFAANLSEGSESTEKINRILERSLQKDKDSGEYNGNIELSDEEAELFPASYLF